MDSLWTADAAGWTQDGRGAERAASGVRLRPTQVLIKKMSMSPCDLPKQKHCFSSPDEGETRGHLPCFFPICPETECRQE